MNPQTILTSERHRRQIEQQEDPAGIIGSSAVVNAYYQHCLDVLMKADSQHHYQSDGRSSPSPPAMDHSRHHAGGLPQPPLPPPPSWVTAMAASSIPWPFISQVCLESVIESEVHKRNETQNDKQKAQLPK